MVFLAGRTGTRAPEFQTKAARKLALLEAAGPERKQRAGADIGWGRAAAPKQSKDPQKLAIAKKQVLLGCIINPTLNSKRVCMPGTTLT